MTTCVMFNEKNEFVGLVVAEPTDWTPDGWRLEKVEPGFLLYNNEITPVVEVLDIPEVTPEVI